MAGVESTLAARVLDSAAKEKEIQEKFDKLKQREVEQVIRLENLATGEQENQGRIDELQRSEADPGDNIRLERLASSQAAASSAGDDVDGTGRLVQVAVQLSEKQNELNRLDSMEREKRSVVRQLKEEERRLRAMVDELTAKVRALFAEAQAKADSAAVIEQQQRSTIEKLTSKDLRLRQTIDNLQICHERLEAKIRAAAEEENKLQSQVGHVAGTGGQRAGAESIGPHYGDGAQGGQATEGGRFAATEQVV